MLGIDEQGSNSSSDVILVSGMHSSLVTIFYMICTQFWECNSILNGVQYLREDCVIFFFCNVR